MNKINKTTRTMILDIATTGITLADEQLGKVVGGMKCTGNQTSTKTGTLNEEGRSDTNTDCEGEK